jgi:hypothetical protein
MSEAVVSAFAAAGEWFVEIAGRDDVAARWDEPSALGGHTVGGVVGHAAAAVAWLGPLLDTRPGGDVPVWSFADYFAPFPVRTAKTSTVRSTCPPEPRVNGAPSGGRRKQWRGCRPVSTVSPNALPPRTWVGSSTCARPCRPRSGWGFLRTRVVELIVHGDDVAASMALDLEPPSEGPAVAMNALLAVAINAHGHLEVLRALAPARTLDR